MLHLTEISPKHRDREWLLMNICEDFLNKRCNDRFCINAHCDPSLVAMDVRRNKVIVCFESLKGVCARINCSYYHAMEEQKSRIIQNGRERQRIRQESQGRPQLTLLSSINNSNGAYQNFQHLPQLLHPQYSDNSKLKYTKSASISLLNPSELSGLTNHHLKQQPNLHIHRFPLFSQPSVLPVTGNVLHSAYPYQINLQNAPFNSFLLPTAPVIPNSNMTTPCYTPISLSSVLNLPNQNVINSIPQQILSTSSPSNAERLQLSANLLLAQGYLPVQGNATQQGNYCLSQNPSTAVQYHLPVAIPTSMTSYQPLLNPISALSQSSVMTPSPSQPSNYEMFLKHNNVDNLETSNYCNGPAAMKHLSSPSAFKICALHHAKPTFFPFMEDELMSQSNHKLISVPANGNNVNSISIPGVNLTT